MDTPSDDPCHCGSGKTHEGCCGTSKNDRLESATQRLRSDQAAAEEKVNQLINSELGVHALDVAWDEFDLTEGRLEFRADEADLFSSWVFYDWEPWDKNTPVPRRRVERFTPALVTLAWHEDEFSDSEYVFLAGVALTPLSFHEVLSCEFGRATVLRDMFLGTEVMVFDNSGSVDRRPGDILYARVARCDEVGLLVGTGEFVLPPGDRVIILDLAARLRGKSRKLTREKLWIAQSTLRGVYLELRQRLINAALPSRKT